MKYYSLLILVFCIVLTSCSKQEINNFQEFDEYINNIKNGLLKSKNINGYNVSVVYLPKEYLAIKELQTDQNKNYLHAVKEYGEGLNFILRIEPDGINRTQDLILSDVKSYEEYKEKFTLLAFQLREQILIKCGELELVPRIAMMEPVYQLKSGRDFNIVFAPANENERNQIFSTNQIDFQFEDNFFSTGMNHFVFDKQDIQKIPTINLNVNRHELES
ncbi:MAG: hypothetical protein AAF487_11215 [Bacteroidota bacterium]